jgi:GxxExxY protein
VLNTLGTGFLAIVYQNALAYELRKAGLSVEQQYRIPVYYDGVLVGNFIADLVLWRDESLWN